MGNFRNVETEFIERTLALVSQYEGIMYKFDFDKQFNYTLLVNCLLGVIVFPKEQAISYLPADRITGDLLGDMGIKESVINTDLTDLRSLIEVLRHSIAHFDISFESNNEDFLIDKIVFRDTYKGKEDIVASFVPTELLSFIRYYGTWFVSNVRKYKKEIYDAE